MDITAALNILDLDETATFEEAKRAYRTLAKKYHPDRVKSSDSRGSDDKMKQINAAFVFLTPRLRQKEKTARTNPSPDTGKPSKPETEKAPPASDTKKRPGFDFTAWLKRRVSANHRRQTPGKTAARPAKNPEKTAFVAGKKRSAPQRESFSQVFKRAGQNKAGSPGKKRASPYRGVETYYTLKKKMRAARQRRRNADIAVGRVEKISPIRPVGPVGED